MPCKHPLCLYLDNWTSDEHLPNSPEFAKNPMCKYVDPGKMVAVREAEASPWELRGHARAGEFAPVKPYDPRALLGKRIDGDAGRRSRSLYLGVVTSLLAATAARCSARLSCSTCWVHSAISSSIALISRAR